MNVFDILVLVIIAVCLFFALRSRKKARDRGTGCCSSCSGGCPGCDRMPDTK